MLRGLGRGSDNMDLRSDRDSHIPTVRYTLFLRSLFLELVKLITRDAARLKTFGFDLANFEWMWRFFAEPEAPFAEMSSSFWTAVVMRAHGEFEALRRGRDKIDWGWQYLNSSRYRDPLQSAYNDLRAAFSPYCAKGSDFMLILCFDEARVLCEYSAIDGSSIEKSVEKTSVPTSEESLFSNFRALRRALGHLSAVDDVRVFALFTDTTSRLHNFQPRTILT